VSELEATSLVVLVPDAELLVQEFRERFDPSAEVGMPAHITVLYPFVPAWGVDAGLLVELRDLFHCISSFTFSLTGLGRFPGVLYLEPDPSAPFEHLTHLVANKYPEHPPYGGAHSLIVPHLTVAHWENPAQLVAIEEEFMQEHGHKLPVTGHVSDVALVAQIEGIWEVGARFRLGGT
jgi:2'-5' RNA ligase